MPSLPGAEAEVEAPRIVPVTVITGYLGAGKTTMIRSLIGALPPGYNCAWLKNEYGDAAVDSAVAADARISVKEVTNGCLCCTKVGELSDALTALWEMKPDRILVEASGSALPGPLVWEIQKLPQLLSVDGVVTTPSTTPGPSPSPEPEPEPEPEPKPSSHPNQAGAATRPDSLGLDASGERGGCLRAACARLDLRPAAALAPRGLCAGNTTVLSRERVRDEALGYASYG